MSKYYKVNGLKVRVSDHEPNERANGGNDIELYIKSVDNMLLSVEAQIECICEKRGYNIEDFAEVLKDFADGSYTMNYFKPVKQEEEEEYTYTNTSAVLELKNSKAISEAEILKAHPAPANYEEVKALAALTGIGAMAIKRYYHIR